MNIEPTFEQKKNWLFLILGGFFISNALVAEIIGVKIFSAEAILGVQPAQLKLFGSSFDFSMTAGAIMWPFVFITTDIINEYFGKEGVRRISVFTSFLILYAFLIIALATALPPSQFWLEVNRTDGQGNSFNIDYAFNTIFRQGLGIITGSLTAFLLGQFIDVYIFHRLRKLSGKKMLWLRSTGSTLVSQLIDSFVVLFIAFYVFGNWAFSQVVAVGIVNYLFKGSMALLMTPLIYMTHYFIDQFLGKDASKKLTEKAADSSEELF